MEPVTPSQIELIQSMDRSLKQMLETMNSVNASTGAQSAAFNELTEAASELKPELDSAKQGLGALEEMQAKVEKGFSSFTDGIKSFIGQGNWDKFAANGSEALSLLHINVDSLTNALTNPLAAAIGFAGGIWDTIVAKAAELAHQGIQFARAMEEVRDKFGDLTQNTSRQVIDVGKNFGSSLREAAGGTGAFSSKFGVGIDGAVAKMQKASELAGDLGATFDALGKEGFKSAADELYVLKDGLAFTSEGLQATTRLAMMGGESLKSFSQSIMASVDKIGKHFGMSTKVLGGDVGKALSNFKMLGKMTGDYVKEITKAAVFTRKLGIELSTLTGIVDKFDDFESGAEAAAQLAQGFGLVIDPLKMMGMEAGPRLAELQKGFVATGRSIESMSRQERALLASTSGLSDEQVQLAFSQKGLSMSYDDISKGADEAAKKQASTQEVMNDLALNIKNILQDMQDFTGFITAFFSGFGVGFGKSSGVQGILRMLAKQLTQVYHIGVSVGGMFSKLFFGDGGPQGKDSKLFKSITSIGDMFVKISGYIADFTGSIKALGEGDVSGAAETLFTNIFGSIQNAFGTATDEFSIVGMAKKFGIFMLQMLQGALGWLAKTGIPSWIKSLKEMFKPGSAIATGIPDAFGTALKGIGANLELLFPLVIELGTEFLSMIPRFFAEYPIASTIGAMFVAGGPILTFITGFGGEFFNTLWSSLGLMASTGATAGAGGAAEAAAAADVATGVGKTMEGAVGEAATTGAGIFESLFSIIEDPLKLAAWGAGIGIFMMALGTAIRDVMLSFTEPLPGKGEKNFIDIVAESANKLSAVKTGDLIALGAIMVGVFGGIGLFVYALASAFEKLPTGAMLIAAGLGMQVGAGLLAIGAVIGVVAVGSGAAGWLAGKIVGGIAGGLASMISAIADAFTDDTFIESLAKAATLGSKIAPSVIGVTAFGSAMEAIAKIVTSTKSALDAIYAVAPDLNAAETSSRELAKQEFARKIASVGMSISVIAPVVSDIFVSISKAFPADIDGTSTASKINKGAANLTALAGAMNSVKTTIDAVGAVNGTIGPLLEKANKDLPTAGKSDPTNLINGILNAVNVFKGAPGATGPAQFGIIGALALLPDIDTAAVSTKIAGLVSMGSALAQINVVMGSLGGGSSIVDSSAILSKNVAALMIVDGPLVQLRKLFGSPNRPGGAFSHLNVPEEGLTEKIDSVFNVLDHYISRATTTSESMADARMRQFSTRVLKITDYMATTRQILENLGTIPLDATIDKLGTDMKVAKSVFSVAGGAVKIAVQMNVTMNAEKISAGLVMGGYIKPTQEFGDYMLANDGVGEYFKNPGKEYNDRPTGGPSGTNARWQPI